MKIVIFEYFEWASLIIGLACFKRISKTPFVFLLPYLALVVIIESGNHLGWFYSSLHKTNNWIYNIVLPIEFFTFFYLFKINNKRRIHTRVYNTVIIFFLFFYIGNILFYQKIWELNTYTIIVISIILLIYSLIELLNLSLSDEIISMTKEPYFWFYLGLLFFYLGEVLLYTIFPFYTNKVSMTPFLKLYKIVTSVSIILLNLFITTSIYTAWKMKKA